MTVRPSWPGTISHPDPIGSCRPAIARSRSASMTLVSIQRHWYLAIVFAAVGVAVFAGVARGQGDLIGSRGGQATTAPLPGTSAGSTGGLLQGVNLGGTSIQRGVVRTGSGLMAPTSSLPTLPSTLNLPQGATTSLLNGLNSSGTATRHGMGWIVSDMAHQGIHGQQPSDAIHQLKPYMQRGVLTFPQNGPAAAVQQAAGSQPGARIMQAIGKGRGKGK